LNTLVHNDRRVVVTLVGIVLVAKLPTLATPYHWDETLWIGFAHQLTALPLWNVLPGLHPPTLFGGRPPGLYLPMAALFKITGPSIWLSHLVIAGFAAVGVAFTYLLGALLYGRTAGRFAALFLFLNPLYFAQAGMFVSDLPVTACGVASVYWALRRRYGPYLICALALVLLKETALAIVFAISAYVLITELRRGIAGAVRAALPWALPLFAMGAYYTAQKLTSGSFFVQYAERFDWLQPGMLALQIRIITRWIFVEQLRWISTALIVVHLVLDRAARRRPELVLFGLIVLCSGYTFSALYLLPRYLLPVMPYIAVLTAGALVGLFPRAVVQVAIGAALLGVMAVRLPGFDRPGTREWDLGYLAAVRVYAITAQRLTRDHRDARILTGWPLTECLRRPELGYVSVPLRAFQARDAGPLDAAEPFEVVAACSLGGDVPALMSYASARGYVQVDRIAIEAFRCDLYAAPAGR
jgi:4-amino-4-deoxy-L-arabinose transferase-like glycosyltransferase